VGVGVVKTLVVDGRAPRRALVCDLLRSDGHDVVEAADPAEAWMRQQADWFDLIVLDGEAPAPGGLDLCRRIREQSGGGEGVVLALIGSSDPGLIGRALESGASVYADARLDPLELATRLRIAERQAGMAADRARAEARRERLLDAAQAAQLAAEVARQRFAFLAEASTLLASSLDYETTLANVARLAVPPAADCCIVEVLDDGARRPRQVAVVHVDPARAELLRGMRGRRRGSPRGSSAGARALATGQSVFVPRVPSTPLDCDDGAMLRQLETSSYMAVPMVVRGRTIGAITLAATTASGRVYGPADLELAEDLARRAAVAVDNARLYAEAQRASARLRALAWAATEAQTAPDEAGVFEVIGAAIVRSGLNVNASLLEWGPEGDATLVVQHVALVDDLLPMVERLLGRPVVGIRMDAERVGSFRGAVREGRVVPVPSARDWLRETLPWMSGRAARVIGRLRQVSQGMAVPLTDGREVLGVLTVWGAGLAEADLAAMELLGRQAGAALAALRHRAAERERDRLDGAMLLARTAAHAINNALGLTSGYAELLASHPTVADDPELAGYAREVLVGVQQAAERVARFQKVTRLEERPSPLGEGRPLLDLERSVAPATG